ncbi:hypothetical protein Tco_0156138 [Tanacetum coccineum]
MSFASSAVTYTSVYTDSELGRVFWGADEEISDGEEPQTPPVPQDEDEREPISYKHMTLTTCQKPVYPEVLRRSDPEEDPEEYDDDETEDGPVD